MATRRLRSQSRDFEPIPELQKPARRGARQITITSIPSDSENERQKTRKGRKPAKKLTAVEEIDAEVLIDEAPATPQRVDLPLPLEQRPFPSPGAISEMSGTTAISSFSMIEAEFLEPKYILKHLRKLCDATLEFLDHLAPRTGTMKDDLHHINEMRKPGSDYAEEYVDFDDEFKLHLKHFKGDESNYINVRAIHRALFGSYNDTGAMDSGINLVLYLANVVVFAKQMIHSSRSDKDVWNHLRLLDASFPSQFMRSLLTSGSPTTTGDSAMLEGTFKLGLDLRIQLTILSLERYAGESEFNPDEALDGIFVQDGERLRGWGVTALGGEGANLSRDFHERIAKHYNRIQAFFPVDTQSLNDGHVVDLDGLGDTFTWAGTVLLLLDWVRARRNEISASIDEIGGSAAILSNIKQAIATPQPAPEEARPSAALGDSPRKKRASFGRHRRRSSRRFDPNAPIDFGAIDALKARERDSGVHFDPKDPQPGDVFVEVAQEEEVAEEEDDAQPAVTDFGANLRVERDRELSEQIDQIERDTLEQSLREDDQQAGEATLVAGEDDFLDIDDTAPSGPPKNTQDMLAALRSVQPAGKENRKGARFVDPQVTAKRVEFGNGFDESSQPTPGPSSRVLDKGKQRVDPPPSVSKKRSRVESEDEDEDAFESGTRTANVQERRQKAPLSKRARVELPSSAPAPPSHQPERASQPAPPPADTELRIPGRRTRIPAATAPAIEREDSASEPEAPAMTELLPPRSTAPPSSQYNIQHALSLQNSAIGGAGRIRQGRRTWTTEQEDAFIFYMERIGPSWKKIADYDNSPDGYGELDEFTQVNLKDKARSMAIVMIKSGTGLRPGFESIVTAATKDGRRLTEAGFTW